MKKEEIKKLLESVDSKDIDFQPFYCFYETSIYFRFNTTGYAEPVYIRKRSYSQLNRGKNEKMD